MNIPTAIFSNYENAEALGQISRELKQRGSIDERQFTVMKSDDDRRLVFGWASVAVRVTGEEIVDWQEDIVEIDELETAAYEYTAEFGTAGEMHERGGVGRLIESVVFTKEKAAAMGIPPEILPQGWWVGFRIDDAAVWEKVKNGEYSMFSIEGTARRVEAEETGKCGA